MMRQVLKKDHVRKDVDKLDSQCEKALRVLVGEKSIENKGNGAAWKRKREELCERIAKQLHECIPKAAAYASKRGGLPNPLTYLQDMVTLEDFVKTSTRGVKTTKDKDESMAMEVDDSEDESGEKAEVLKKAQSLKSEVWHAVSTYNLCVEEYLRETLDHHDASSAEVETPEKGGRKPERVLEDRERHAKAMLNLFKEDLENCMESETTEEPEADPDRAEMLMLGLMQGFDMLSQLEKEVVVEALAP